MRRRGLIAGFLALAAPAAAQEAPRDRPAGERPRPPSQQRPGTQRPPPSGQPRPPAAPPPAPARPAAPPAPAPPPRPVLPPIPLPPAMGELVGGGWRLDFAPNRLAIEQQSGQTLRAIGQRLAETTTGRILLLAQASGPQDASTARRLSLDRAIAVKEALQAGGLPGTRVDIRALGQLPAGLDAVDILPPGAPRP